MKNQCFWNTLFAIFIASGISCTTFVIQSNLNQKKEYRDKEHSNSQHQNLCISTDIDTEVSTTSARVSKIILLKNKFKDLYEGGGFEKNYSTKENKAAPPYAVGYSAKHRQTTEKNERREYMATPPPKNLGSRGNNDDENQSGVVSRPKPKSKANPKAKPKLNANPKSKPSQKAKPKPSQKAKPKLNANPKPKPSQKAKPKLNVNPKSKPSQKANPKSKPSQKPNQKAKPKLNANPNPKPSEARSENYPLYKG